MKLYDNRRAPNPRRVRIFLAEKKMTVASEEIDLGTQAHKSAAFTAINPFQRVPALVLDDGSVITEAVAICRYFESLQPDPALFGRNGLEVAVIEMWEQRMEHYLLTPVSQVFRHLHPAMKALEVPQVAQWGESNKARVMECLAILDRALAERRFVAADIFSMADITALAAIDWMRPARLEVPPDLTHVHRWYAEVSQRPSAKA